MNGRRLGVALTPLETRREVVLRVATRAEELGYDAFYLAEGWGNDAAVLLTEVALRTSRIRLCTGVLNVWGRSAAQMAMLAVSLAEVSHGRFTLGLGAGSPQLAEGWHDVAFRGPVQRLETVTRQVRGLLDGERLTSADPARPAGLRLATRTAARVPIHVAALGSATVRLSGALADGWYPFLLPISAFADRARLLAAGVADAGRTPGCVELAPCLPTAVSADPSRAREIASWWVAFYLTSMGPLYRETLRGLGFGDVVDDVVASNPDRGTAEVPASAEVLLDELTVHGDPDTGRARLDAWYAAGAQMPVLALPPNRPLDELDRMLVELAP